MGRSFPEGNAFFERERTAIPNLLAAEQADVASKHTCRHPKYRYWFAELYFYAETRQESPIRFDQGAA